VLLFQKNLLVLQSRCLEAEAINPLPLPPTPLSGWGGGNSATAGLGVGVPGPVAFLWKDLTATPRNGWRIPVHCLSLRWLHWFLLAVKQKCERAPGITVTYYLLLCSCILYITTLRNTQM